MSMITSLEPQHINTAVSAIARAFYDDPMSSYIEPNTDKRHQALVAMQKTALNMSMRFGTADQINDGHAVVLWLNPGATDLSFVQALQTGMAMLPFKIGLGTFRRMMGSFSAAEPVHEAAVSGDHWYLMILAVDPDRQGQSMGRKLLEHGLERADANSLPVYLQTSKERNLSYYQKFGFEITGDGYLGDDGPQFWGMLRPPQ